MDAFQGCYKFEPYDCRYWAAFYLFLRLAVLYAFAITQSGYFMVVCGILLILATMTVAIIKPYRKTVYNIIDVAFLSTFVQILFSTASLPLGAFNKNVEGFLMIMCAIGLMVPAVYITILAVYKILPKTWITLIMEYTIIRLFRICCHQSYLELERGDVGDPHAYNNLYTKTTH